MATNHNFKIKNGLTVGSTEVIDSSGDLTAASFGTAAVEKIEDTVNGLLTAGTGISLTYDDNAGTLQISGSAQYGDSDVESYLDGGTSTPVFSTINSGAITSTGAIQGASFSDGTISGITFIDEDSFATNSATRVPTQQSIKAYVDAQVAGVVDSAPEALNTLNELAAALGDDANFSTTTSTALGNRLRVDTAAQGLTGTQQANAITNLGITATKAELNYVDGVTSNIQTQLNSKANLTGATFTGTIKPTAQDALLLTAHGTESGHTNPHGLRMRWTSAYNVLNFAPMPEGVADSSKEFGYSFINDKWFVEGGIDVTGIVDASSGVIFGSTDSYLYESAADTVNIRIGADGPYVEMVDAGSNVLELGNASGALALTQSGSEGARLTSTGLGIGTSSPANPLHVATTGSTYATLRLDAGGNTTPAVWLLRSHDGVLDFRDSQNSATRMTLDSSGNVGIGTSSPSAALHVAGAFNTTAPTGNGVMMGYYSDSYGYVQLNGTSGGYIDFSTSGTDHKGRILYDNTSNYLRLDTNSSEAMRIDSSGNVGIGTTSPEKRLHIFDTSQSNQSVRFGNPNATPYGEINYNSTGTEHLYIRSKGTTTGYGNIVFETGSALDERMRIDSSGNVGIGTSSPSNRLTVGAGVSSEAIEVNAGAGWADLKLHSDATNGGSIYFNDGADAGQIFYYHPENSMRFHTDGSERFRIDGSGNAIFTKSGGAYLQLKDASAVRGAINVTTSDGLVFTTGASFTERMRIDSSGNVGIGTTSPDTSLEISIGSTADGLLLSSTNTNTSGRLFLQNATAGQGYAILQENGKLDFRSGATAGTTSGTQRMRIDSNGNLLVGTTDTIAGINGSSEEGVALSSGTYGGVVLVSRSSGSPIIANRQTTDGDIQEFRKDGSTVGSAATYSGTVQFGQGNANLKFSNASDAITPANGNGTNNNNAIDIGSTSAKFKDGHFGGTGYFDGNIKHTGLTMTSGTDIDQLYTATVSLQLSTSWQDTGINGTDLSAGTYIIQVYADDFDVGGQHYREYYSGIMSWASEQTNSGETDEILLHRAGHAPNNGVIYLRTERVYSADTNRLMLQIRGDLNATGNDNYLFKFRRMI